MARSAVITPEATRFHDVDTLMEFPQSVDTAEKRILYALLLNYPSGYCAPSLVTIVNMVVDAVYQKLDPLYARQWVVKKPLPQSLRTNLKDERDGWYYVLNPERRSDVIAYLRSS